MSEATVNQPSEQSGPSNVRDLRRRWKPTKEGPAAPERHQPICIRLHRCWSWLQRLEELDDAGVGVDDARLIYGWIALNSLYGRWDPERREPVSDLYSLGTFLSRLFDADADARIGSLLTDQRELVTAIVGDEFLSRHFWQDPGEGEARRAQGHARKLGSLFYEKRYAVILDMVLKRVYLARCQLVHGAATHGGQLNREAVGRCAAFIGHFLPAASLIIIDHAWDGDWDGLCYPPMG